MVLFDPRAAERGSCVGRHTPVPLAVPAEGSRWEFELFLSACEGGTRRSEEFSFLILSTLGPHETMRLRCQLHSELTSMSHFCTKMRKTEKRQTECIPQGIFLELVSHQICDLYFYFVSLIPQRGYMGNNYLNTSVILSYK